LWGIPDNSNTFGALGLNSCLIEILVVERKFEEAKKGQSKAVIREQKTMQWPKEKRQKDKTLHGKLTSEQHESH